MKVENELAYLNQKFWNYWSLILYCQFDLKVDIPEILDYLNLFLILSRKGDDNTVNFPSNPMNNWKQEMSATFSYLVNSNIYSI